jgi:hypothetical protein
MRLIKRLFYRSTKRQKRLRRLRRLRQLELPAVKKNEMGGVRKVSFWQPPNIPPSKNGYLKSKHLV